MSLNDTELETVRSLIKTIVGHPRRGGPASGDQSPRDVGSCIVQVIAGITPYIFQDPTAHPSPLSASQRISVLVTVLTLLLRVTTRSVDDSALAMALHQISQASSDVANGLDRFYSPAAAPPLPPQSTMHSQPVYNTPLYAQPTLPLPAMPTTADTNSQLPPIPTHLAPTKCLRLKQHPVAPDSSWTGPRRRSGGSVHGYQPYPLARLRSSLPATIQPTPVDAHQALTTFLPPVAMASSTSSADTTSLASAPAVPPSFARTLPRQAEMTPDERVFEAWTSIFEVFEDDLGSLLTLSWVCPLWRKAVRSLHRKHGRITDISASQLRHLGWIFALSGNEDVTLDLVFTNDTQLPALYDVAAVMHRVVKLGIRTHGNYMLPDDDIERVLVCTSSRLRSVELDYGSAKKLPSGIFGGAAYNLRSASVSLNQLQPDEITTCLTEVCEQVQTLRIPFSPADADGHDSEFLCAAHICSTFRSIRKLLLDGPFPRAGKTAPSGASASADGGGSGLYIDSIDIREQPDSAKATLATLSDLGASRSLSVIVRDASQTVGVNLAAHIKRPTELAVIDDDNNTRHRVIIGEGKTRIFTGNKFSPALRTWAPSITVLTFPLAMDAQLLTAFTGLMTNVPKLEYLRFLVRLGVSQPSKKVNILLQKLPPWKCCSLEQVHFVASVPFTGDAAPSIPPRVAARQLLDFTNRQLEVPHRICTVLNGVLFCERMDSESVSALWEVVDIELRY